MIIPRHIGERVMLSGPPTEIFELIHNISMYLLMDDKQDLGRFIYYDRHDHWYHGRNSPHHPTAFHHWQIGALGLMVSQIGALVSKGMEMYNDYKTAETGGLDGHEDLSGIMEDNTISLEEYKEEVEEIPESPKQLPVLTCKPNVESQSSLTVPKLPSLIGLPS